MQLATSTNLLSFNRDGSKTEMVDLIPKLKAIGYSNLDLNFCEMMNPKSSLTSERAEEYLRRLISYKTELQVDYVQSHVPYTGDYLALEHNKQRKLDSLIKKAIEYSALLGVDTIVIHPIKGIVDDNLCYFERVLKDVPNDCKLAIENMDAKDELYDPKALVRLVKQLQSDQVGLCLDTGHAALNYESLVPVIEEMGQYLIATHIADNHGLKDEHLLPFFGTIKWEEVMKAFKAVNYDRFLTYEVMFFTSHLPDELKMKTAKLSLEVGDYLLSMAN